MNNDLDSGALALAVPRLAELAPLSIPERRAWIRATPDCRTPGMLAALLAEARSLDGHALGWAWSAVEAATAPEHRALAWALLGNAERKRGDLEAALSAFGRAEHLLPVAGDAEARAETFGLLAAWSGYLFDWSTAARRAAQSLRLIPPDSDLLPMLRIRAAIIRGQAGDPSGAIHDLRDVAHSFDPRRHPWFCLVVSHALASFLALAGEHGLADRALLQVEPLYSRVGGCAMRLKAEWIRARIDLDLGHCEAADARLAAVEAGLVLRDPINAGLLRLERAQALLGWGRFAEAAGQAMEAHAFFSSLRIPVEAAAAAITAAEAIASARVHALPAVIAARRRLGA